MNKSDWKEEFGVKIMTRQTMSGVKVDKLGLLMSILIGFSPAYPVIIYWIFINIL